MTMENMAGFGKCTGVRTPSSVALPRPLCKAGDVALGACLAAVGVKPVKVEALNRYLVCQWAAHAAPRRADPTADPSSHYHSMR